MVDGWTYRSTKGWGDVAIVLCKLMYIQTSIKISPPSSYVYIQAEEDDADERYEMAIRKHNPNGMYL